MNLHALLDTSPEAQDRRINLLLIVAAITAVSVVVITAIGVPKILSNESATKAVARGNEITSCRASFRAAVDDASSKLQTARARLDVFTSEGLAATVADDTAALLQAVAGSSGARSDVTRTAADLEAVTGRYSDLVDLSRTNPEQFLTLCRQETDE